MVCLLCAAYLVAVKRGYPAGTFRGWAPSGAAAAQRSRSSYRFDHPGGDPLGHLHRDRSRFDRGDLHDPADLLPVPHDDVGHFLLAAAKAVKTTGVVLLLIGVSAMFQYLMGLYEVADFHGPR
jgi:hypothetical protein